MSIAQDWTCRCGAKNDPGARWCEGCGGENPKAEARAPTQASSRPTPIWHPPPDPPPLWTEAEEAQRKADLATLYAKLGPSVSERRRGGLSPIDPAVRAAVARRGTGLGSPRES